MTESERQIAAFESKVRQLILKLGELKKEQVSLLCKLDESENLIKEMKARLDRSSQDYEALKIAKMIEVSDSDIELSKKRLSKLIRDVNKCITMLSAEE